MTSEGASATAGTVIGGPDEERGDVRARHQMMLVAGLDVAILGAVLAVECLLFVAAVLGWAFWWVLVGVHGFAVAVLARRVMTEARASRDTVRALMTAVLTAAAGPIGMVAGGIGAMLVPRGGGTTPLMAAWYERIAQATRPDPVTVLCDSVAIGRGLDLSAPAPASFASVIHSGTLVEQQAALGLVARDYHPAYIGALKSALRSPEPVIRVQAAAVAARLRGGIAEALEAQVERARTVSDPLVILPLVAEIDVAAASGLVDQTLAGRGAQVSRRLKTQLLSGMSSVECGLLAARLARAAGPDSPVMGTQILAILEAVLGDAKLWPHLRVAARAARVVRAGGFSVRRRHERPGRAPVGGEA